MPKINSLYTLIKETSQQKGHPLKIICDWDDTIQSYTPQSFYKLFEKCLVKNEDERKLISFDKFFSHWAIAIDAIKEKDDFYKQAPFISTADDLLLSVKERLISELIFLSYFNKRRFPNGDLRKEEKFRNTFGKLSQQAKLDMKLISSSNKPQWIKENHPDFDIFVDDLPATISESVRAFPDKIFVMPEQELNFGTKCERIENNNVYHLQVKVSSLKDENFEVLQNMIINEHESKIIYIGGYRDKIN